MAKIKLDRIEAIYKNLIKNNIHTIPSFDFKYNKLEFTLLLIINNNELFFLKKGTTETFSLEIIDFIIDSYFSANYSEACDFFEIKYSENSNERFKPGHLIDAINHNSIYKEHLPDETRRQINRKYTLENPDAIYYYRFYDHIKNGGKTTHSDKNREKVRILLPELYERLKGKDVSIGFTADINYKENEKIKLKKDVKNFL